ncbi:E3 SUMO-protein ligase ZBED1-like [Bactrocera dorsalis]|uniref:E3 SUMO-protein ligase ZBED1-like n=1 Tax=Bactrocera dorsalis TaxID=27457 RepID=A0ABM3J143_BACDO|nr:E3 SUMO-protein ligase ZBED1-like [Bactrocera dorsalis]
MNDHLRRRHPSSHSVEETSSAIVERAPAVSDLDMPSCSSTQRDVNLTVETIESEISSGSLVPPVNVETTSSSTIPSSNVSGGGPLKRKAMQTKLFVTSTRSELSETEKRSIDESLIKMITRDMQPLSIVENEGFREYTKKLQPLYSIPDRKLLSNTMLPSKYNETRKKLHAILLNISHLSITTDMWTTDSQKSFLSVTSHFIWESKMNSAVLATKEVFGSHTAQNIATELKSIFDEWSIFNKIVTIVSDNGANIKKAIRDILQKHHHPCVAHTLNLCVVDAIKTAPQILELITKCRAIVTYFHHSSQAAEKLKNMQKQMGVAELKMKQDVATRWNSGLIMMERICLIKEPLSAVLTSLPSAPNFLNASEWERLRDSITVLKPIEHMTTELSAQNYPTMSLVVPIVRGLQYAIRSQQMKTMEGECLKSSLLEIISRRLGQLESDKMCAKSTFLDPRFKKIAFGNESNASNAQKWLGEEVSAFIQRNQRTATAPVIELPTDKSKLSLWTLLDQKVAEAKTICRNAPSVNADISLEQYLRQDFVERHQNPLNYWDSKKATFPELYELSKKYLCIPATSVPSERVFSKAGQIINDRRNRLKGEKLDQILFLNSNFNI